MANDGGAPAGYPVTYDVEYPDREVNRLTSALRIIVIVPIAVVLTAVAGGASDRSVGDGQGWTLGVGGVLFLAPLLMIVFRQKYPRWWFDWNVELMRFGNRVIAYLALLRDEYPSTDDAQAVRLDLPYPDVRRDLNRWLPLVKWLLVIPHYVVLVFMYIAASACLVAAWFAILVTGRYPRGLFDFVVGVLRWSNRVVAYAFVLVTDEYPPFQLSP